MKYFLKTTYPCLVKISEQEFELEPFDTLEIEDEKFLFVYPTEELFPFYINLSNPVENEHFSILNHDKKCFLVLEKNKSFETEYREKLSLGGKVCIVSINDISVSFETENRKTTVKSRPSKDYQIFKIKNFAIVQFDKEVFAFNISDEKLFQLSGDKIDVTDDEIRVEKALEEGKSHLKKSTYKISDQIVLVENKFSGDDPLFAPELLPFKFLECVKQKDFDSALEKLSPTLKEQITKENLGDFFGNFSSILPLNTSEFITLSQTKKNFVKFSIKDDKVEDILIDEL